MCIHSEEVEIVTTGDKRADDAKPVSGKQVKGSLITLSKDQKGLVRAAKSHYENTLKFKDRTVLEALCTGAALNILKGLCKHGEWTALREQEFPHINHNTASCWMRLEAQISQSMKFDSRILIGRNSKEKTLLAGNIQAFVNGRGVMQLLFDYDIRKDPKAKNKPATLTPEQEYELLRKKAKEQIQGTITEFDALCEDKSWVQYLEPSEIREQVELAKVAVRKLSKLYNAAVAGKKKKGKK